MARVYGIVMQEYIKIFNGYRHAYGIADWTNTIVDSESGKKKPDYRWSYNKLTDEIYQKHLAGKESIGVQPTNENGNARFGVIDIDPKQYKNFNKQLYFEIIQKYKLPLIPIESKSGGLHLYLFMNEFVQSTIIVSFLSNLLPTFNLRQDCEIFPKQTQLTKDAESGAIKPGQFINLPYFNSTQRKAFNIDGTFFTLEQFIKVVELNLATVENLTKITEDLEYQTMEGVDDDFLDGPPCLPQISKISKEPSFDGKDRFMYNYHVLAKMKFPDTWQQKVKNAPVKYFETVHANAWDDKKLNAKLRSWDKSEKGYTCKQSPLSEFCKKGICVKKKFGVIAGSKGAYPVINNLRKIDIDPEPEYEFDITKPDGIGKATVHCKTVEHIMDQRKRRNAIAKAAGIVVPIIKGEADQIMLEALFAGQTPTNAPIGTSTKEKLHDILHAKINGPKALNDASFKSGTVLIEGEFAYFRYDKFYDKLKSKNWKHAEDKTGILMEKNYKDCEIKFIEQKRFPSKEKGKHNTPTKNIVSISIKKFEEIIIKHTRIKHNTEIM